MNKTTLILLGTLFMVFLIGCAKTDSQIEKESGIDIIRDGGDCLVICQNETKVNCGQPCPITPQDKIGGDALSPIEERLSDSEKQSCSNTGGQVIINNKNEVCQCPESNIIGATNQFSPREGCKPFCDKRGFRATDCPPPDNCLTGKENTCALTVCGTPKCIEISAKELCENSDGSWRTDVVFIKEPTKDERDIASCQCPERSIGYTPHFGCDYRVSILTVNSVFSIYPLKQR